MAEVFLRMVTFFCQTARRKQPGFVPGNSLIQQA